MLSPAQSYDDEHYEHVEDMPPVLIAELEIYFCIDASGIQRCLDEGFSVAEIKQICRDIHYGYTLN